MKAKRRVGLCVLLLFALFAISAIAVHKKFGRAYVTRSGKIQFRPYRLLVITNENRIWALFDAEHLSISDVTMLKEVTKEDEMLEQLKKISGYLEPKPTPPPPKGLAAEFLDFLSKYKVMGLAVAFIIGIYLGAVVQALVNDLIMPIVSYATGAGGGNSWQTLQVGPFLIGNFLGTVLTFVIVAFVIFLIVKVAKRWNI